MSMPPSEKAGSFSSGRRCSLAFAPARWRRWRSSPSRVGRTTEALEYADQSVEAMARQGSEGFVAEGVRAQVLLALGRTEDARASIARARGGILRVASTIEDPAVRQSYLTNVAIIPLILAMADALPDGEPPGPGPSSPVP